MKRSKRKEGTNMKKVFTWMLALLIMGCSMIALAEDTGIQIIGGKDEPAETVNLDNMKVGETAKIEGFGDVTITEADWYNNIENVSYDNYRQPTWKSGSEADYLYLKIRILNTQKKAQNYLNMFGDVVCDFGDGYQFGGWIRQRQNDTDDGELYVSSSDGYDISPLYAGQYGVIVTLPNSVVNSKEPLSVTFKIGENEFTYHHRK